MIHAKVLPVCMLLGLLVGCSPTVEACTELMPVNGVEVEVAPTPDGQTGCACKVDDVSVAVLAVRDGVFRWKRGAIWIDGAAVAEQGFSHALERARVRKLTQRTLQNLQGSAAQVLRHANAWLEGVRDALSQP